MSKFNVDKFCNHLNFNLAPLFNENSCSVNEVFSRLISIFGEVVDQFASKRKALFKHIILFLYQHLILFTRSVIELALHRFSCL